MADLELRDLCKNFGQVRAVENLNVIAADGEFVTLLGPSGCGKSTTLNLIAGLEQPTSGDIYLGGSRITDLPPNERGIGMVFQDYALYPHMSVFDNIAFSLKLRRVLRSEIERMVRYVSKLLDIEHLLERRTAQLSGGQQQRVAVARALAKQPRIFLFDEPLSNLDAALRVRMRTEIRRLHLQLQTTSVFVTHDQEEAMTISDRIAVMRDGKLEQLDTPMEIYRRPRSLFVATFIGKPGMNVLQGRLQANGSGLSFAAQDLEMQWSSRQEAKLDKPWRGEAGIGVRAEDVILRDSGETMPVEGSFTAEVSLVEPVGSDSFVEVSRDWLRLLARVNPERQFQRGQTVQVELPAAKLHIFESETDLRLNG